MIYERYKLNLLTFKYDSEDGKLTFNPRLSPDKVLSMWLNAASDYLIGKTLDKGLALTHLAIDTIKIECIYGDVIKFSGNSWKPLDYNYPKESQQKISKEIGKLQYSLINLSYEALIERAITQFGINYKYIQADFIKRCEDGCEYSVLFLLAKGIDPNCQGISDYGDQRDNCSALMIALMHQRKEIVDILLKQANIDILRGSNFGLNIIHWASVYGYVDILENLLLTHKNIFYLRANNLHSPLCFLINNIRDGWPPQQIEAAQILIENSDITEENIKVIINQHCYLFDSLHPLPLVEILNSLRNRGIALEYLLIEAVIHSVEAASFILDRLDNCDDVNKVYLNDALKEAAYRGYYEIAKKLVDMGADVNYLSDHPPLLQLLYGFGISLKNSMLGDGSRYEETVDLFLNKKADIYKKGRYGSSVLNFALNCYEKSEIFSKIADLGLQPVYKKGDLGAISAMLKMMSVDGRSKWLCRLLTRPFLVNDTEHFIRINQLIDRNAKIDIYYVDDESDMLFIIASRCGDLNIFQSLLASHEKRKIQEILSCPELQRDSVLAREMTKVSVINIRYKRVDIIRSQLNILEGIFDKIKNCKVKHFSQASIGLTCQSTFFSVKENLILEETMEQDDRNLISKNGSPLIFLTKREQDFIKNLQKLYLKIAIVDGISIEKMIDQSDLMSWKITEPNRSDQHGAVFEGKPPSLL